MELLPTHYFSKQDLEPVEGLRQPFDILIGGEELGALERVALDLREERSCTIAKSEMARHSHIALFIATLRLIGATTTVDAGESIRVDSAGHLASDLPYILFLYLKHGFSVFDDWNRRTKSLPDRLTALEFLHFIERRRIECSRKAGFQPETIRTIPVSYAIIKARSESLGADVYLFELNKDWNLFNLIGGKQEPEDNHDYRQTF
jgi:hypothetical protein